MKQGKSSVFILRALLIAGTVLVGIGAISAGNRVAGLILLLGAGIVWFSMLGDDVEKGAAHRWPALLFGLFLIFGVAPGERLTKPESTAQVVQARQQTDEERELERHAKLCSDTVGAYLISKEFVVDNLRTPSTAKFPRSNADGVSSEMIGDCRFRVAAYVDAQNSFGATVRSPYEVELMLNPETEKWHALKVNIMG